MPKITVYDRWNAELCSVMATDSSPDMLVVAVNSLEDAFAAVKTQGTAVLNAKKPGIDVVTIRNNWAAIWFDGVECATRNASPHLLGGKISATQKLKPPVAAPTLG